MGLLLDESKHGRAQVLVPSVVIQETTRRFADEVRKQGQSIVQLEKGLRRFGVDLKPLESLKLALEDYVSGYNSFLRSTLEHHGARFLDTPNVPHQRILDRVLSRRKPISEDGRRGYQDTLIWETILAQHPSKDNVLYFITNDSDFAERSDANSLSLDLREDLIAAGGDSSGVVLFSSLKEFTDRFIKPNREFVVDWAKATPYTVAQGPRAFSTRDLSVLVQGFLEDYANEFADVSPDAITGFDPDASEIRLRGRSLSQFVSTRSFGYQRTRSARPAKQSFTFGFRL